MHNELLTSKLVTSPERLESDVRGAAERKEAAIKEFDAKRLQLIFPLSSNVSCDHPLTFYLFFFMLLPYQPCKYLITGYIWTFTR